jgi:hypothetical protein
MNISFNIFSNYSVSLLKQKIVPSFNLRENKILIVAFLALGFLTACSLISYCRFKQRKNEQIIANKLEEKVVSNEGESITQPDKMTRKTELIDDKFSHNSHVEKDSFQTADIPSTDVDDILPTELEPSLFTPVTLSETLSEQLNQNDITQDSCKLIKEDEEVRIELPPLTEEQRNATFGASIHYSDKFKKKANDFHAKGDTWTIDELRQFFNNGLMRYYLAELSKEMIGIEFDYNYDMWLMPESQNIPLVKSDKIKFQLLFSFFQIESTLFENLPDNVPITKKIQSPSPAITGKMIAQQFSSFLIKVRGIKNFLKKIYDEEIVLPPQLQLLGAHFQKSKVETEKLHAALEEAIQNGNPQQEIDDLAKKLLDKDQKETELRQQMVFHWIRDCIQQIKDFIDQEKDQEISFENFQFKDPEFLKNPKYEMDLRCILN